MMYRFCTISYTFAENLFGLQLPRIWIYKLIDGASTYSVESFKAFIDRGMM